MSSAESKLSRERFEKAHQGAFHTKDLKLLPGGEQYLNPTVNDRWRTWQAAERDTREHCAQQLTEIAEQSSSLSLRRHMRQGSERIRGKE